MAIPDGLNLRLRLPSFLADLKVTKPDPTSKKQDRGGMVQPRTLGLGARGYHEARSLTPRRDSSRVGDLANSSSGINRGGRI
ncbi:hypothetical protein CRG98_019045 [Punica granatum]|uniref:Uncharacterized protein n=1 Tax=Punica granatum TaxID=22663 RepID=A0A2I0JW75_PUNGR|nr:hypothetical protein CRG98_019045 [Punica granatum]